MVSREIDTGRLIDTVHKRKCFWDASDLLLLHKNKDAHAKAWDDIVCALFENFASVFRSYQHDTKAIRADRSEEDQRENKTGLS